MGLITNEIEVNLSTKSISRYRNLGYEIPQEKKPWGMTTPLGTKIMIQTTDLPDNSSVVVTVQCDDCGKIYDIEYRGYIQSNHNGDYYCNACACKRFNSGRNHYNWNENISDDERRNKRKYPEYKEFIKRVLARDNYSCVITGKTEKETTLVVHHLNGYDWCIEGRCDVTNAVTISEDLHLAFHARYGNGGNTKEQFEEFFGICKIELKDYKGVIPIARQVYDIEENNIYTSAVEYAEVHGVAITQVYSCCNHKITMSKHIKKNGEISWYEIRNNTISGHHVLWYEEYQKMSPKEIEAFINHKTNRAYKDVICITTGKIFSSIAEASRYSEVSSTRICKCCKGKQQYTANPKSKELLRWMYYKDFLNLPQDEQEEILSKAS